MVSGARGIENISASYLIPGSVNLGLTILKFIIAHLEKAVLE